MNTGVKMKTIIDEITACAFEYEMSTGMKPTRIYIGRQGMLALGKWAYENGYQDNDGTAAREGQQRPIVYGLVVYEVNDDGPHMRCSV